MELDIQLSTKQDYWNNQLNLHGLTTTEFIRILRLKIVKLVFSIIRPKTL